MRQPTGLRVSAQVNGRMDAVAFAGWLKANEAHARAWASYEQLWGRLQTVRDDPRILALRESAKNRGRQTGALKRWAVGGALAATLVLAAIWITQRPVNHVGQSAQIAASTPKPAELPLIRIATTERGERSLLLLPDGSRITLNSASSVRTDYSSERRRVTLVRGQAFFEVAKDPARPFIVTAGSREVVAVGTAFDVRLSERQLRVTLVTGKVRILPSPHGPPAAPAAPINLDAGSAMTVRDGGPEQIEQVDTAGTAQWHDGKLNYIIFDAERLSDVVREMNRHSREQLVIADPALRDKQVSGVFDSSAGRAVARALQTYGLAHADTSSPNVIVLSSP